MASLGDGVLVSLACHLQEVRVAVHAQVGHVVGQCRSQDTAAAADFQDAEIATHVEDGSTLTMHIGMVFQEVQVLLPVAGEQPVDLLVEGARGVVVVAHVEELLHFSHSLRSISATMSAGDCFLYTRPMYLSSHPGRTQASFIASLKLTRCFS